MANIDIEHIRKAEILSSNGRWIDITEYMVSFTLESDTVISEQIINFISEDGHIFLRVELTNGWIDDILSAESNPSDSGQ